MKLNKNEMKKVIGGRPSLPITCAVTCYWQGVVTGKVATGGCANRSWIDICKNNGISADNASCNC